MLPLVQIVLGVLVLESSLQVVVSVMAGEEQTEGVVEPDRPFMAMLSIDMSLLGTAQHRRATPRSGMHRRPNATVFMKVSTKVDSQVLEMW